MPIDPDSKIPMMLRMPREVKADVAQASAILGISQNQIVEEAIRAYLGSRAPRKRARRGRPPRVQLPSA